MRITNSTILRNYDRNLKRLSTQKFQSENRIYSGRQYTRASQSPLKASKALTIRKQLMHTEQYKENLDVADKFYTEAETSLLQISEELATVRETLIYACNSTKDKEIDLNILAQQLETSAKQMCSVFNTDTAERAIFGGESNSPEPFNILYDENGRASAVTYHGVPLDAYSYSEDFPYSKDVFIDIGIGMVMNDNQEIDPQSALKISFNGADITGCGYEKLDPPETKIILERLKQGADDPNTLRINAGGKVVTVNFTGADMSDIRDAINTSFTKQGLTPPALSVDGELSMADGSEVSISRNASINIDELQNGKVYTFDLYSDGAKQTVSFTAGANRAATAKNLNDKLQEVFLRSKNKPFVDENGEITVRDYQGNILPDRPVYISKSSGGTMPTYQNENYYSNNYIQVTIDAAAALRRGDLEYANACIDRIVTAGESLLVEIADLGNAEEYIEFNTNRFDTRELNLKDRQKSLEATDLKKEITLLKTYEALYNACLQMSSSVVPNSIFNYIK